MRKELKGQTFGRWTVLDKTKMTGRGETKWLCRCSCGNERYVLERSLLYGGSLSCGCLRKENAAKAAVLDLAGKQFGELTVLHRSSTRPNDGRSRWLCRCSCGKESEFIGSLLTSGKRVNCGDPQRHTRDYAFKDITGKHFSHLTVLYPTEKRSAHGNVVWHCRCDCGNEVDLTYNNLVYSHMKSCGCIKEKRGRVLHTYLIHMDKTSLDMIRSKKIPRDNTSGVRGVYLIRGKYVAKIVFQKNAYYLGSFENLEEARRAREAAEALLFDGTVDFYEKWEQRALADPAWAERNPIRIHVTRDPQNDLQISYSPEL